LKVVNYDWIELECNFKKATDQFYAEINIPNLIADFEAYIFTLHTYLFQTWSSSVLVLTEREKIEENIRQKRAN